MDIMYMWFAALSLFGFLLSACMLVRLVVKAVRTRRVQRECARRWNLAGKMNQAEEAEREVFGG